MELPKYIMGTEISVDQNIYATLDDEQKAIFLKIKSFVSEDKTMDELSKLVAPHI